MLSSSSSWNPFRKPDSKELVRKWKASIRGDIRAVDREINGLILEQKKAKAAIKEAAKRNDMKSAKLLAKELIRLRNAVTRLATNKATLLSLSNQMTQTLALSSAVGTIKASTGVMTSLTDLAKVPQLQKNVYQMAKEMERAGYIQEFVTSAMDSAIGNEDEVEAAAEDAVEQVLLEITGETLLSMGTVPNKVPQQQKEEAAAVPEEEEDNLMEQLAALKAG